MTKTKVCLCLFIAFIFCVFLQASGQTNNSGFSMSGNNIQTIEINHSYSQSVELEPFIQHKDNIFGLAISAEIEFDENSDEGLIRVVLQDNNFNEYLVYETYPLLDGERSFSVSNVSEETALLDNIKPIKLILEIRDATIHIKELSLADGPEQGIQLKSARNEKKALQIQEKIKKINANIRKKGLKWVAGPTELAEMTYAERKKLFGNSNIPPGIEFYIGGIITVGKPSLLKSAASSQYIDVWDWRNRHGKNWVTPVTNQGQCGSCWAFSAVGATEALANLYFNDDAPDLDLSEQDVLSCSDAGDCDGGYAGSAIRYIAEYGVVDEAAFPYSATKQPCSNKSGNPSERIKVAGYTLLGSTAYQKTTDELKRMLIEMGPASSSVSGWSHAMVLVGYHTVKEGDTFFYSDGDYLYDLHDISIEAGDPLIGTTLWIFKNSWGSSWGDNGYSYFEVSLSDLTARGIQTPVTSEIVNREVQWTDNDGDGFYWWGLGNKPAGCPGPDLADGNDNDPFLGPLNEYGFCTILTGPPVAGFDSENNQLLAENPVRFYNRSSSNTTAWQWFFEGGIPATSTDENPVVVYHSTGQYDVTLIASSEDGADTLTKADYIEVIDNPCLTAVSDYPYNEQFVNDSFSILCWDIVDHAGNGQVWSFDNPGNQTINTSTANNGFAILDSDHYGSGNSQNSDLISPAFDFTGFTTIVIQFDHYFVQYSGSSATFSYSLNHGNSWTELQSWTTTTSNAAVYNEDLTSVLEGQPDVRFKWNYTGSWGYYWAVDDFQVTAEPIGSVSQTLAVSNVNLTAGTTDCFNATNTITVAGDGTNVTIESGASAEFIAGQNIRFLPGFHAQEGSYVHGHITTTGEYCVETAPAIVAQQQDEEKTTVVVSAPQAAIEGAPTMQVYPNPNSGVFTVKFSHLTEETRVMLFNSIGQMIFKQTTTNPEVLIDLPGIISGMYIVKAVSESRQFSRKIVVK